VLQCVAVCCIVLQCVAERSVLQCGAVHDWMNAARGAARHMYVEIHIYVYMYIYTYIYIYIYIYI